MKALYQMSIHAPEVAEGDVSDGVHGVEGDDVIEVGVLLVIAFGALIWRDGSRALVFLFFLSGRAVTGVGGRRGLSGTGEWVG